MQYILTTVITVALFLYAYFLCSSITYAVAQKELASRSSAITDEVSVLESKYLEETKGFTQEQARAFGLIAIAQKEFTTVSSVLGRNDSVSVAN
jgi:hypothetical protein